MNISILLLIITAICTVAQVNASKQLHRLRVPNANNADTNNQPNGRILQGSMSMATTESISDIEHKEVIDTIVSKLEASGVPVDPAMMLAH